MHTYLIGDDGQAMDGDGEQCNCGDDGFGRHSIEG